MVQAGGHSFLLIDAIYRQWGVHTCPAGKAVWVKPATSASTVVPNATAGLTTG
jgi:hypothetical protein